MENVKLLFSCITHDMMEPVGYLPWGLCAGCLYLLALKIWRRFRRTSTDRSTLTHDIIRFLLVVYGITLLKLAFFSREPGSRTTVSTHLFDTWGTTMQAHAFFIENILMFIPFGILIPVAFSRMRGFVRCTTAAFTCSVLLEGMQFITGRGFCELDDIVTNTVGAVIGYMLYRICINIFPFSQRPSGGEQEHNQDPPHDS